MCEQCENHDDNEMEISIQNTSKFLDELRYLCTFAIDGNVHPVLTAIISIFVAVVDENIETDNSEGLKEFYELCYQFADKQRKKLGQVNK